MEASKRVPLVVVVPTCGRADLLERTVDSLMECQAPDRGVRIVVVENGGRHGVEAVLAAKRSPFPLEYRFHEQGNKSAALNAVIEELPDALVVFFDDDVRVHPDILRQYDQAAGALREGRFFGGGLLVDYETPPPEWLLTYLPLSSKGWHPQESDGTGAIRTGAMKFTGANWAAFSRDILRLGGFSPQFGPGGLPGGTGQETDMQCRLVENGAAPHYIPDAVVWHYVPEERCSPEWAIKRGHRMGVRTGYINPPDATSRPLLGAPLWLLRSISASALSLIPALICGRKQRRFDARFTLQHRLGCLKGHRRRHREQAAEE